MPAFQRYRTPEVDAEAALRYPQIEHLLTDDPNDGPWPPFAHSFHGKYGACWGEANSTFRAFQEYMIKLVTKDTDFPEALANFCAQPHERFDDDCDEPGVQRLEYRLASRGPGSEWASSLQRVFGQPCPEVWSIPSKEEIAYIKTCLGSYTYKYSFWERMKWRL